MGSWGYAPWDSDAAADWFGGTFDATGLAKRVEEALASDPEEDGERVRAAAAVLILLGRTYVWPINEIDRHLDLAIERLTAVLPFQEGPCADSIKEEIAILRSRRANARDRPVLPQPAHRGKFWS